MTILIGIHHELFLERDFPSLSDPPRGSVGMTFAVMQQYTTAGFIPVWGARKFFKAVSVESGQPIIYKPTQKVSTMINILDKKVNPLVLLYDYEYRRVNQTQTIT